MPSSKPEASNAAQALIKSSWSLVRSHKVPDYKSDVMSVLFDFRPDLANNDGHIRVLLDEYSSRYLITRVQCLKQKPEPRV